MSPILDPSLSQAPASVSMSAASLRGVSKSMGEHPVISEIAKSDLLTWPPMALQALSIMAAVVVATISFAFFWQSRSRDLV